MEHKGEEGCVSIEFTDEEAHNDGLEILARFIASLVICLESNEQSAITDNNLPAASFGYPQR